MTIDYTKPQPQPRSPIPIVPPSQQPKTSGCLKWGAIGCLVVFMILTIAVCGLTYFVFRMIRSTDVYVQALHRAQTSPQVTAVLGEPVAAGWWITGNVKVDNQNGTASITFPIFGPKGKARVHADATGKGDTWTFSEIKVKPEKGSEIDLLAK